MKSLVFLLGCGYISYQIRQYLVTKYEPVLHKFNSYGNLRSVENILNSKDIFDDKVWLPEGAFTDQSGLILTAGVFHKIFQFFKFTSDVTETCIYFSPIISALTSLATYLLAGEIIETELGACLSALLMSFIPGHIAVSTAGTFDSSGLAICLLVFTFYFWTKAVKTGCVSTSMIAALFYGYLFITWESAGVILNIIAIYIAVLALSDQVDSKVFVAYSTFHPLSVLLTSLESMDSLIPLSVFLYLHLNQIAAHLKTSMPKGSYESCLKNVIGTLSFTFGTTLLCLYALGCIEPFSVAMMAIINPAYAKEHHPMRVSGAGHQAAAWSAFFVDCHFTVLFIPIGLNLMFKKLNKQNTFLITYLTAAMYCSANQIVALSWLCPAACIISGYTINHYYETFSKNMS